MGRRDDYRTFYGTIKFLIIATIGLITLVYRFLKDVARLHLWSELGKSLLLTFVYLVVVAGIAEVSAEIAGLAVLAGIIYFCWWWHNRLSYIDTRLNANLWRERAWWWTLDGWQFEQEVAKVFRMYGYKATVTKGSGDGGVDIILKKDGYCGIVQCKHYQNPVPPEPIRALWGCKDDFNADEVILVASSGITDMGARFVQNKPAFKVLNLDDIIRMSQQAESIPVNHKPVSVVKSGRKLDM